MNETPTRTWLSAVSILVTVSIFGIGAGVGGLLVGGVVAVSWFLFPPLYAFTIGQFAFVALFPNDSGLILHGLIQASLLGLLVAPMVQREQSRQIGVLAAIGLVLLVMISWMSYRWIGVIWKLSLVLAVGFAVVAYGLHRYERLVLGLLEETS